MNLEKNMRQTKNNNKRTQWDVSADNVEEIEKGPPVEKGNYALTRDWLGPDVWGWRHPESGALDHRLLKFGLIAYLKKIYMY